MSNTENAKALRRNDAVETSTNNRPLVIDRRLLSWLLGVVVPAIVFLSTLGVERVFLEGGDEQLVTACHALEVFSCVAFVIGLFRMMRPTEHAYPDAG